jgi:hypothetical protein
MPTRKKLKTTPKATPKTKTTRTTAKPGKTPAKKPARQAAARSTKPVSRAPVDHAALARTGDLDSLFGLMDLDASTHNDRLAYKWLCAASDFGHQAAEERIADVLEVSSLRYDDDAYETAAAHWELACAYLEGTDGLPIDLVLARKHLVVAFENHDLATINAGTNENYSPATLLLKLTGDAWTTLQTALVNVPGDNPDADAGD